MSFDSDLMQIQDICEKVCSGGTPSTRNKEFYIDGTIPWIKTKEVNNCKIFSAETHITEEALAKSSAKLIPDNSVIIAMYGNGDTAGRVAINKIPVATNQACCNLIVEPTKADYRFVFYYLRTQYQKLVDLKNGGAQQNLNAKLLKEYPFPNVPRAKQTDIADFLEQLDDKIALNTQTNQTLEQIAQDIFKSWFVDFDPVKAKVNGEQPESMDAATASLFPEKLVESELGLIPEGWEVLESQKVATVAIGKTPPRKEPQWFSENPENVTWISIKDMGNAGTYALDSSEYLTPEAVDKFNVKVIPDNTLILSFKLTVGRVAITYGEMTTNEAIAHYKLADDARVSTNFLYSYMKQFNFESLGPVDLCCTYFAQQYIGSHIIVNASDTILA